MTDINNNPFQSPEQQQNDIANSMWSKFSETNDEIAARNDEDDKKKHIIENQIEASNFAQQAHEGHDTQSSYLDP